VSDDILQMAVDVQDEFDQLLGEIKHGDGEKKGRQRNTACRKKGAPGSGVGFGLAQALDAVADLPLAALLQEVDALEAFEDVAFDDEAGDALEAFVL
jgi:hypothetical protein